MNGASVYSGFISSFSTIFFPFSSSSSSSLTFSSHMMLRFRWDGKCSSLLGEPYTCHRLAINDLQDAWVGQVRQNECVGEGGRMWGSFDSTMRGKIVENILYIQKYWIARGVCSSRPPPEIERWVSYVS